ncbi:hypothetical protein ACHQM5_026304 [Ranunculus cassubicifolius]
MLQEVNSSYWQAANGNYGDFSTSEDFSAPVNEFQVQLKRAKLFEYNGIQQQGVRNLNLVATGPSPLGLSLKKTPSFEELIQATLYPKPKPKRGRPKKDDAESLKAKSLNAELVSIGSWERRAVKDQDVVAKCYYQKKKLVWEILDGRLKRKIEIQWSDITAIRAAFPQNMNAVLEIEVKTVPLFYRERPPQPRKQSHWELDADFTGGQACQFRRHHLQFREGTLQPLYEKLMQCDRQLFTLSQQPFPVHAYPYFNQNIPTNQDSSFAVSRSPSEFSHMLQHSPYGGQRPTYAPHQVHIYEQPTRPSNHSDLVCRPINGGNNIVPLSTQHISFQHLLSSGKGMTKPPSTNSLLKDISTQLLDGPVASACPDEQKLMARIQSMCNLLDLSHEQSASNHTNTSDVVSSQSTNNSAESSYSTNNSTVSRSSDESNVSEESKSQASYNWMSAIGLDDKIWKGHQRIPSFSDLFFDEEDAPGNG